MHITELFEETLPIDYQHQGDNWLNVLTQSIQQKLPDTNGYSLTHKQASSEFTYPHLELTLHTQDGATSIPADTPSLKIVPFTNRDDGTKSLYVALSSHRDIPDAEKSMWIDSINEASKRLEESVPEFEWAAMLAQANDPTTQKYSLKKKFTAEGLTIRSARRQFLDKNVGSSMPRYFNSSSFSISWPVVVEGKSKGFDWSVAAGQASLDTHKIAALLSLAWNSTWYLLHSPIGTASGSLKLPTRNELGQTQPTLPYSRKPRIIPSWFKVALANFDSNPDIKAAVTAYYQGLQLTAQHPSFALVAFVSSIEIIGKRIIGEKCECCGNKTSSNQRFRAGVNAVVTDSRKAKEIYNMYVARSVTAHAGELHANEEMLGSISFPSMFNRDDKTTFVFIELERIRNVSRNLLVNALKGKY